MPCIAPVGKLIHSSRAGRSRTESMEQRSGYQYPPQSDDRNDQVRFFALPANPSDVSSMFTKAECV